MLSDDSNFMKTKIVSLMLIATIMFGFFLFGSGGNNGFNAHFYGSRPSYTYQSSSNLFRAGFNANNNYVHSGSNFLSGKSSSLNYHFGAWAV